MKQHPETGAPANAKKLEQHASEAEQQVVRTRTEIQDLLADLPKHDGSDEKQKKIRESIDSLYNRLGKEYDLWLDLSKQVVAYDKAVSETRRDGAKILQTDAEEFFQQYDLSLRLAIESYIISLSQDATRAESPEQFYQAHAGNLRSCVRAAIDGAIKDNKLPGWAKVV